MTKEKVLWICCFRKLEEYTCHYKGKVQSFSNEITSWEGKQTEIKPTKQKPTNPQLFRRMKTEEEICDTYRDWSWWSRKSLQLFMFNLHFRKSQRAWIQDFKNSTKYTSFGKHVNIFQVKLTPLQPNSLIRHLLQSNCDRK